MGNERVACGVMKRSTLTHLTDQGAVHMVKIGDKSKTARFAIARAEVETTKAVIDAVRRSNVGKGDVLAVVRIAAIGACKRTSELIPLCHPVAVTGVDVRVELSRTRAVIQVRVDADDRTGAEMEAMVAAAVGALTFYDMCKSLDHWMCVTKVVLLEKSGGKSGHLKRPKAPKR